MPRKLEQVISSIDGKDYGACKALKGIHDFNDFKLHVEHIPSDPYAPPHTGLYRVEITNSFNDLFGIIFNSDVSRNAFTDFLTRIFHGVSSRIAMPQRGTGYSGVITIAEPGQAILERNAVIASNETIDVRFFMGLPANGRKFNAAICREMMLVELPGIVHESLVAQAVDVDKLVEHIHTAEDGHAIRSQLRAKKLVAFVANGSVLPRESGISDRPLDRDDVIQFVSPPSLEVTVETPHSGKVNGMGIPEGVTLITGGGYHGKSTLLEAVQMGIYNHVPGDGREKCITTERALKVRAYSGRFIEKINISPFITNLPLGKDTLRFSTENASGSTSQAASIMEAVEMEVDVLLMDEDTCATNFMIRDNAMQKLVSQDDEPITTFIDRVRELYDDMGISTVLALGGIGDYFSVADTVIQVKGYQPLDVTGKARSISTAMKEKREIERGNIHFRSEPRVPLPGSIDPENNYGKLSIYAKEVNRINFGKYVVDLTDLEQLVEISQAKGIADAMLYVREYLDGRLSLSQAVKKVMNDINSHGLDAIYHRTRGQFAWFRDIDFALALSRLRSFKIK